MRVFLGEPRFFGTFMVVRNSVSRLVSMPCKTPIFIDFFCCGLQLYIYLFLCKKVLMIKGPLIDLLRGVFFSGLWSDEVISVCTLVML